MSDIPNYHYRDDGLKLWSAISIYVADVIDVFFENDIDVKEDVELQEWVSEISRYKIIMIFLLVQFMNTILIGGKHS